MGFIASKLKNTRVLERVFRERLSEPLHLNAISALVALFGSTRSKVYFDLLVRQQHAYGMLTAADRAKEAGHDRVTVIEFGVANGAGLMNMCKLAPLITRETGVAFDIVGFDAGSGMPAYVDYRDHPEFYQPGWFPMQDPDRLRAALPDFAELLIGPIAETLAGFTPKSPVGFVSLDVDYYSSSVDCLKLFALPSRHLLPWLDIYLDDVQYPSHNEWAGELLAVREWTSSNPMRPIGASNFLRERRLFKNATWISHFHTLHVLDHPSRERMHETTERVVLGNPYLDLQTKG